MSQLDQTVVGTGGAAEILGWSRAKVKREVQAGRLPYVQKLDGKTGAYIFRLSTIETIAANRARAEAVA